MPRYFFHIHAGENFPDKDGTVLDDDTAARAQAIATAGGMLRDQGETFWGAAEWRMIVVDNTGKIVCEVRFSGR